MKIFLSCLEIDFGSAVEMSGNDQEKIFLSYCFVNKFGLDVVAALLGNGLAMAFLKDYFEVELDVGL